MFKITRQSRSLSRFWMAFFLLVNLFGVQPMPAQAAPGQPAQASGAAMEQFLTPGGTLNVPQGFSGSINPAGYDLSFAADGSPRFTRGSAPSAPSGPTTLTAPGIENWASDFAQNGASDTVYALLVDGTDIYIGGVFRTVGSISAQSIARWDGTSWHEMGYGFDADVTALALDAAGNLYAGGWFTGFYTDASYTTTSPANYIAMWDGAAWSQVGFGLDNGINALAFTTDGALYAGGEMTAACDDAVCSTSTSLSPNLVKFSGGVWSALGLGLNDTVLSLAASGTDLYIGGWFTGYCLTTDCRAWEPGEVAPATSIVQYSPGTGFSALGFGLDADVDALLVDGADLYAGGGFVGICDDAACTTATTITNYVAKYSGGAWSAVGAGFDDSVYALKMIGGELYAGGSFSAACDDADCLNPAPAYGMAHYSGGVWSEAAHGVGSLFGGGSVYALGVSGTKLIVGGGYGRYFTDTGHTVSVPAHRIAAWDSAGAAWSIFESGNGLDQGVSALTIAPDGTVYLGGSFTTSDDNTALPRVAKWDGVSFSALGFGLNDEVKALALDGSGNLFAGGTFTGICSDAACSAVTPANHIAIWNGVSWSEAGFGLDNNVYALVYDPAISRLYVGGMFTGAYQDGTHTATDPANNAAYWNGSGWSELGFGLYVPTSVVSAMALAPDGTLYINTGNPYDDATHTTYAEFIEGLPAWNPATSTWSRAGGAGFLGPVSAMVVDDDGTLYFGGEFNQCRDALNELFWCGYLVKWKPGDPAVSEVGYGVSGFVRSLALDRVSGILYIGGFFFEIYTDAGHTTSTPAKNMAKWDGASLIELNGGANQAVNALAYQGGYLYAGGDFDSIGSPSKNSFNIARWTAVQIQTVTGAGDYGFYADTLPVTVSVVVPGSIASIHMQRYDKSHPAALKAALKNGYYWGIEAQDSSGAPASGYSLNLIFTPPFTPTFNSRICQYTTEWQCALTDYGATTIQWDALTSLGDFAVGDPMPNVMDWNTFQGSNSDDFSTSVAVDALGNIYVTGNSLKTWETPLRAHYGDMIRTDVFVAKLNSAGVLLWNTFLGASGTDNASGIGVSSSLGAVFVSGYSDATWGAPIRSFTAGANGYEPDTFVARLNSATGALEWNSFFGGAGTDSTAGKNVLAVNPADGRTYVTGASDAAWGSPLRAYTPGANSYESDAFAAALNPDGSLSWLTFLGSNQSDQGFGAALDPNTGGNLVVSGESTGSWGGCSGCPINNFSDASDAFAASLDPATGVLAWNTFQGGASYDTGTAVAIDSSGSVYMTGSSSWDWGSLPSPQPIRPFTQPSIPTGFDNDAFVVKLNNAGVRQWFTFLGSEYYDYGYGITVDEPNGIYVSGDSTDTWETPVIAHSGGSSPDGFVARVSAAGVYKWNSFLGAAGKQDTVTSVAATANHEAVLAGFSGATWGDPVRAYTPNEIGYERDGFVVKLPPDNTHADTSSACLTNVPCFSSFTLAHSRAMDQFGTVYVYQTQAPTAQWIFNETFSLRSGLTAIIVNFPVYIQGGLKTAAGTTFIQGANDITLGGDFINNGVFSNAGGSVTFFGGSVGHPLQKITANIPITIDFGWVYTGTTLIETLEADNINVTSGIQNDGVIRKSKTITGTGSYTFGLASLFTLTDLLTVNVGSRGTLSRLQVDFVAGNHPHTKGTSASGTGFGNYWMITPTGGGYNLDITLPFDSAAHPDDTLAQVCRYVSGPLWDCARNSSTPTTTTRSEIAPFTSPSDFALGYTVDPTVIQLAQLSVDQPSAVQQPMPLFILALSAGLALLVLLWRPWARKIK